MVVEEERRLREQEACRREQEAHRAAFGGSAVHCESVSWHCDHHFEEKRAA